MSAVHQLYCTHCTYGSSAIEQRQGAMASQTLGYGPRASSLRGEELRRCYRQVERFLNYRLPSDTPAELKLQLTASSAPRRLFYSPSVGGLQLVGQISYRQMDTAGRPGSYFAHFLVNPGGDRWSTLDCLRLWGAGWTDEDIEGDPCDLPMLPDLQNLLADGRPAIDDNVLWSFLTAAPGGAFDDPKHVIPDRLRVEPAEKRAGLLAKIMHAYLGLQAPDGRHESVIVVAEPELAALLFYGVTRLLPEGALRQGISFSTFEPDVSRVSTALVGTSFFNPGANELRPELYRGPGYALNSFSSRTSDRALQNGKYADVALDVLRSGRFAALDALLARFQTGDPKTVRELETLAQAEAVVPLLLAPSPPLADLSWRQNKGSFDYVSQAVAAQLAERRWSAQELTPLIATDRHFLLVELLANDAARAQAPAALRCLLQALPADCYARLLGSERVPGHLKVQAFTDFVSARQAFPPHCDAIWQPVDRAHSLPPWLAQVLAGVHEPALAPLTERMAATPHLAPYLASLVRAYRLSSDKQLLYHVKKGLEKLDDEHLWPFLAYCEGEQEHLPWPKLGLPPKIDSLLWKLAESGSNFPQRLKMLDAWSCCATDPGRAGDAINAWKTIQSRLLELKTGTLSSSSRIAANVARRAKPIDYDVVGLALADALLVALPPQIYTDEQHGPWKLQCLQQIGQSLLANENFLPGWVWEKMSCYFNCDEYHHRSWPATRGGSVAKGTSNGLAKWLVPKLVTFGIVAAVALVVFISGWYIIASHESNAPPPTPPVVAAADTRSVDHGKPDKKPDAGTDVKPTAEPRPQPSADTETKEQKPGKLTPGPGPNGGDKPGGKRQTSPTPGQAGPPPKAAPSAQPPVEIKPAAGKKNGEALPGKENSVKPVALSAALSAPQDVSPSEKVAEDPDSEIGDVAEDPGRWLKTIYTIKVLKCQKSDVSLTLHGLDKQPPPPSKAVVGGGDETGTTINVTLQGKTGEPFPAAKIWVANARSNGEVEINFQWSGRPGPGQDDESLEKINAFDHIRMCLLEVRVGRYKHFFRLYRKALATNSSCLQLRWTGSALKGNVDPSRFEGSDRATLRSLRNSPFPLKLTYGAVHTGTLDFYVPPVSNDEIGIVPGLAKRLGLTREVSVAPCLDLAYEMQVGLTTTPARTGAKNVGELTSQGNRRVVKLELDNVYKGFKLAMHERNNRSAKTLKAAVKGLEDKLAQIANPGGPAPTPWTKIGDPPAGTRPPPDLGGPRGRRNGPQPKTLPQLFAEYAESLLTRAEGDVAGISDDRFAASEIEREPLEGIRSISFTLSRYVDDIRDDVLVVGPDPDIRPRGGQGTEH